MSSSNYYFGRTPVETLGNSPRYWYALRRNDDGELYFVRSDQLIDDGSYEINTPGDIEENFEGFAPGTDYFEGIDAEHNKVFENLVYTQYRWDDRLMFYYVDDEGRLAQKIFGGHIYPDGVSS